MAAKPFSCRHCLPIPLAVRLQGRQKRKKEKTKKTKNSHVLERSTALLLYYSEFSALRSSECRATPSVHFLCASRIRFEPEILIADSGSGLAWSDLVVSNSIPSSPRSLSGSRAPFIYLLLRAQFSRLLDPLLFSNPSFLASQSSFVLEAGPGISTVASIKNVHRPVAD